MSQALTLHDKYAIVLSTLTAELRRKQSELVKAERRGSVTHTDLLRREIADMEAAIAATHHLWAALTAQRQEMAARG